MVLKLMLLYWLRTMEKSQLTATDNKVYPGVRKVIGATIILSSVKIHLVKASPDGSLLIDKSSKVVL